MSAPTWPALAPPASTVRRRVLLVEDDAAFRVLLARKLGRQDCDVTATACAEDALDAVADAVAGQGPMFDVVVSDVRMHGVSGLSLLAVLHSLDPRLPVVLITAFCDAATQAEATRLGVRALVSKPFDLDAFCAIVLSLQPATAPATAVQ